MRSEPAVPLPACSEVADIWQAFRTAMESSDSVTRQAAEGELEETMGRFVALVRKAERAAQGPESKAA